MSPQVPWLWHGCYLKWRGKYGGRSVHGSLAITFGLALQRSRDRCTECLHDKMEIQFIVSVLICFHTGSFDLSLCPFWFLITLCSCLPPRFPLVLLYPCPPALALITVSWKFILKVGVITMWMGNFSFLDFPVYIQPPTIVLAPAIPQWAFGWL